MTAMMSKKERQLIDFMSLYSDAGCMGLPSGMDSYKGAHSGLYRPDVRYTSSYVESRGYDKEAQIVSPEMRSALTELHPDMVKRIINNATIMAPDWKHTLFFGLQMFLKRYLNIRITIKMVKTAAALAKAHGIPYPEEGWMIIAKELGGKLPLRIKALPEGSVVSLKNALVVVENTDPRFAWLPSFVETMLIRAVWYPVSVATLSMQIKTDIYGYLQRTSENPDAEIGFKLHDFGARGVSSQESAMIGGASHIVNFMGSDTFEGIIRAMEMYGLSYVDQMPAFSIPATEHSTMTSWGGPKFEVKAFENAINKYGNDYPLLAIVSDSYSLQRAVKEYYGDTLKQKILQTGNTLVVRPDSGDPTTTPVQVVQWLAEKFGAEKNSKGYLVLPKSVRVIQGDGVNQRSIRIIMKNMMNAGFSIENIAFGMGGALLQGVNRDTLKFAQKTCAARVEIGANPEIGYPEDMDQDGWYDVYKDPEGDHGKKSKAGRLAVVQTGPITYETVRIEDLNGRPDALKTVWLNGEFIEEVSFDTVRQRAHTGFLALYEISPFRAKNGH